MTGPLIGADEPGLDDESGRLVELRARHPDLYAAAEAEVLARSADELRDLADRFAALERSIAAKPMKTAREIRFLTLGAEFRSTPYVRLAQRFTRATPTRPVRVRFVRAQQAARPRAARRRSGTSTSSSSKDPPREDPDEVAAVPDVLDEACFVEGRCPACGAKPTMCFEGDPVRLAVTVWHHDGCPALVDDEPEAA